MALQHEFPDVTDISGLTRTAPPPAFVPWYCTLDKKVLRFFGHFHETVPDGVGAETSRVRNVHVLQDETLALVEPRLHNSGLDQGILVKRHRIPKNSAFSVNIDSELRSVMPNDSPQGHWTDLNIGTVLRVYGRKVTLTNCDAFTRSHLASEWVELAPVETGPPDIYQVKYFLVREAFKKKKKV